MKFKAFTCLDTGILYKYNKTAKIYVSEDAADVLTIAQAKVLLGENKLSIKNSLYEGEAKDDEAVDTKDDEDDDEAKDDDEAVDTKDDEAVDTKDDEAVDTKDDEDDDDTKKESLNLDFSATITEEDKTALFKGEELSESFINKTVTIFEAAVSSKVKELAEEAKTFYKKQLTTEITKLSDQQQTQINEYLDYVVTEWMADNELAIENSLKNDMNEEFLNGLQKLFTEHYVEVPDGRYDILEGLATQVEALEEKLNVQLDKNSSLFAENRKNDISQIITKLSSDLSDNQKEKFTALVEHLSTNNVEKFESSALELKESYFKEAVPATKDVSINEADHKVSVSNSDKLSEWDTLIAKASGNYVPAS